MLDIRFIRENRKLVEENLKKKFMPDRIPLVSKLVGNYERSIKIKQDLDSLRHKRNQISEEINRLQKEKKDFSHKIKEVKEIPDRIKALEKEFEELTAVNRSLLIKVPNIMHKSVPIGKDASENKVIKKWGKVPKFKFPIKNHVELAESLGVADFDASAETSGNGFYFLKGELALLNQALIRFAIDTLVKKRYTYVEPPLIVREKVAKAAGNFEQSLQTMLYKVEGEDLLLIPTSEHAVLGMLTNKAIPEEDIPLKFCAYSMCFRKEIGSHGINEKGLWRTHQFNKVEQFVFCRPEDSWKYYDELQKNSEELFRKLKIPYRIFECCSGDLGDWKAKSSDLEAYRPTTGKYEEVGSLSNCTDYQARDLNIKCIDKKGEKRVLHTLNNTAIATSRVMVVILENYQQKDGSIKVPAVLQKYMGGIKKIGGK
ncbi:MAG: serine--tRNA ligase [archaeon]